jgi:hypothetical protein
MYKVFNDLFERDQDIVGQFSAPADALAGAVVHYARCQYEDYQGSAIVIFEKDGKLFEVYGSHCSCNGLEGQWEPEETSWEALKRRNDQELQEMLAERDRGVAQRESAVVS